MWFVVIPLNILLECFSALLQVDPHYAYDGSFKVSLFATISQFFLVHGLQVGWMMLKSFLQENICSGLLYYDVISCVEFSIAYIFYFNMILQPFHFTTLSC
jgi:hypothetical protein